MTYGFMVKEELKNMILCTEAHQWPRRLQTSFLKKKTTIGHIDILICPVEDGISIGLRV